MKFANIAPVRATNDAQIGELVKELQRQSETRRDYVVPGKDLHAHVDDGEVMLSIDMGGDLGRAVYEPTYRAHQTLWDKLSINSTYYQMMGDAAPDLLAHNINYWLEHSPKNYLVRTLDDKIRAVMSNRFRSLDSVELFFTTFQEVKAVGAKIVQADLTENNFYLRVLHPEWAEKVQGFQMNMKARKDSRNYSLNSPRYSILDHLDDDDDGGGTYLVPGITVTNSDVGAGSLHCELFIFDLICSNGMIGNRTIHQVHLGKELDIGFISQETRELEDRAIWSKVRDMIRGSFDRDKFLEYVKRIRASADIVLDNPMAAVETVVKNYGFSEEDQENILNELLNGGSNTVYGLLSAVTATGRDKANHDETIKFERAGGDILDNPSLLVPVRRFTRSARSSGAK